MISVAHAAAILGLSRQRVALLCKQRRIPGARLLGRSWAIPEAFAIIPGKVRGPNKPKATPPTVTVIYEAGVPATVRAYCDAHSHQIANVDTGGYRSDGWRYMAWLRNGWNCGDDIVHSVIGTTATDLITRLRRIDTCHCETCKGAWK